MLLKTFGGLSIAAAEGAPPTVAAQRRRLCLLAVLADAGDAGVTREKLLGLLWPERDEEKGRASLAQALYAIRRDLGAEDVIEGTTTLRLNESRLSSDVGRFRQASREGRVQEAAACYEGAFLDGVHLPEAPEFERWMEERRAVFVREAGTAMERAAESSRDAAAAAAWWRRRAALDPYDSRVAASLMRALAAAGDRAGAIRHGQIHASLVEQELGIRADPGIARLAEDIRAGRDQPAAATPSVASSAPAAGPPPAPAALPPAARRARRPVIMAATIATLGLGAVFFAIGTRRPAPSTADAAAAPVLAIGAFNGHGEGAAALTGAVTDLLATSLARSPQLTVISTGRLHELVSRQRGSADTAHRLLQAARAGGATDLIDGALYTHPRGLRLDLRRTRVSDGRVSQALTIEARDLFTAIDSGTRRLLAADAVSPSGSIADVTTGSLAAYRLYAAGLREFFGGRGAPAYALFTAALAEDSLFAMAEFQASQTAPDRDLVIRHLNRAARLASRASERERLLIRWNWASFHDEPVSVQLAESLVTRFAAEPFAWLALATTLHAQARFVESNAAARRALELDRGAPMPVTPGRCLACEGYDVLVSNYRLLDSGAAAEREARRYTREFPRAVRAWIVFSEQLLSDGKVAEALDARRRAVAAGEPLDLPEWQAYTGLFDMDYARVDEWFVGRLRSGDAAQRSNAAWWLTISYRAQGRWRDALETAGILRHGGPSFGQRGAAPYEALSEAQVLAEMGRAAESAALFDSIARLRAPGITESRLARHRAWFLTHAANSRALAGDTAGLLALADSIEMHGRGSVYARDQRLHHHVRGLAYAARGAHREAAESFRRAVYSPIVGYTRTNLALARELVALGRPLEAVPWLRAALKGGSEGSNYYLSYSEIHEALALAFEAAGRRDSARVHAAAAAAAWRRADASLAPRVSRMIALAAP